tara:strand:- start:6392 stop:7591 length:1200 start_codon:yes stop_codon:yes gene_type:complete
MTFLAKYRCSGTKASFLCKITILVGLCFVSTLAFSQIKVGAEQYELYASQLEGKKVALIANQSSLVKDEHLVDFLLSKEVDIVKIFSPEHGFRGTADAGQKVHSSRDKKTGLACVSLYGKNKKPSDFQLKGVDVLVFDLQDVGVRFYTYLSTLHYIMEAAAENQIEVVVLDRPNPNIDRIDGPILEENCSSFIGIHPIPVLHGMTLGELAKMINNEAWLANGVKCKLSVVPVKNYTRVSEYTLKVRPSPNLPNHQSIRLYPSLCFFEGTIVSIGRGTDYPFQVYGHPFLNQVQKFAFTPHPIEGASNPKLNGKVCYGYDLRDQKVQLGAGLNLSYLIDTYHRYAIKEQFFNKSFFRLLAGTDELLRQIQSGMSEAEIKRTWQTGLTKFKSDRKPYLLYN